MPLDEDFPLPAVPPATVATPTPDQVRTAIENGTTLVIPFSSTFPGPVAIANLPPGGLTMTMTKTEARAVRAALENIRTNGGMLGFNETERDLCKDVADRLFSTLEQVKEVKADE